MCYRVYFLTGLLCCVLMVVSAQIVNIEDKRQGYDTLGYFGQLTGNFNWVRNTSNIITINGLARLDVLQPHTRWLVLGQSSLIRSTSGRFINDRFTHLRYGRKLRPWLTVEAFGQLQFNELLEIKLRGLLGVGPRLRLAEEERLEAYLGVLYMYEYDDLGVEEEKRFYRDHRLSSYLSFKIKLTEQLTLANSTYYQPILFDFTFPRVSTVTDLSVAISGKFSIISRFSLLHDDRQNRDFPEVPATVFNWSNGLRFSF